MKLLRKGVTELQDVTITHVSYVKRGANKKTFFLAKSETAEPDIEFNVKVLRKEDDAKKLLYGIVYEPGAVDAHGDMMNAEEIEKMAHEFITHYRAIDKEHNLIAGAGEVVESYIVPTDSMIGNTLVKAGSWVLVTKASQEIWEDYLNGDITGYSMYGIARKSIEKSEPEVPEIGWVQKFMEKAGLIKSFQETVESEINRIKHNPGFIMAMVEEEFWKNIDWKQTDDDQLTILANSMAEAVDYIRSLVASTSNVEKTDDNTTESEADETSDNAEENKSAADKEETNDTEEAADDTEAETAETDKDKLAEDLILDIEQLKQEIQELKEMNEKLASKNEEITKSLDEKDAEIEKLMVRSNFHTTIQDDMVASKPKPRLF